MQRIGLRTSLLFPSRTGISFCYLQKRGFHQSIFLRSPISSKELKQHEKSETHTPHFKESAPKKDDYLLPHPIWDKEELNQVQITHEKPKTFTEKLAFNTVRLVRSTFDLLSGYSLGYRTEKNLLNRIIFLETIAAVPGFTGAMIRHLNSLRKFKRDKGWIHTLLEEAENERMHLMTALEMKKPGMLFRFAVVLAQGIFTNWFFLAYLISPTFCHRFVGYLEEEAVKTYTGIIEGIDNGTLKEWKNTPAPEIAKNYWKLGENAMWRDVMLAIRADESHHRDVNHTFSQLKSDHPNPFLPGY